MLLETVNTTIFKAESWWMLNLHLKPYMVLRESMISNSTTQHHSLYITPSLRKEEIKQVNLEVYTNWHSKEKKKPWPG